MAGAVRLGDNCSNESNTSLKKNVTGSMDVYINGLPAHRVGDSWDTSNGDNTTLSGSSTVIVNGRSLSRIGDSVTGGESSTIISGSLDVIVDESKE